MPQNLNPPFDSDSMEQPADGSLNRVFEWLCFPFSSMLAPRFPTSRLYAGQQYDRPSAFPDKNASVGPNAERVDTQTQTAPQRTVDASSRTEGQAVKSSQGSSTAKTGLRSDSGTADQASDRSADGDFIRGDAKGPDGVLANDDGSEKCAAFALEEGTVSLLAEIIRKRKALNSLRHVHQEVSHTASTGQGWLEYAPIMLEEAGSQEKYDELQRDIEQRTPEILRNVEREETLRTELHSKAQDLEFSRAELEDVLEEMFLETQPVEEDCPQSTTDSAARASNLDVLDEEDVEWQELPMAENEREDRECEDLVKLTEEILLETQMNFDSLRDVQRQHKIDYRQNFEQGVYAFPESELDLVHLRQGQEITRALIEAEEAHDRACATARGRGVFYNDADTDTSLVGSSGYGLDACGGPALANYNFDPMPVQAWADGVPQCEGQEGLFPELDEWDSRTVNMSDSVSVLAEDGGRKSIDQWARICDAARRGAYNFDAGAMAKAVMHGELHLS